LSSVSLQGDISVDQQVDGMPPINGDNFDTSKLMGIDG
jgi:hypothetical protein